MSPDSFFVLAGLLGMSVTLLAYGLLSFERLRATELRYQLLNIVGTTGILVSLLGQWNLPMFVLNVAWLLVGIVSTVRIYQRRTA